MKTTKSKPAKKKSTARAVKPKPKAKAKPKAKRKMKNYSKPGEGAIVKPRFVATGNRERVELPIDQAEAWGFLNATQEDIASLCGVSRERVSREFAASGKDPDHETEFVSRFKAGKHKCRMAFRKKMISKAMDMDAPSITIFTAKNILGWTDKTESSNETTFVVRNELGPKPRFAMDLTKDPTAKN